MLRNILGAFGTSSKRAITPPPPKLCSNVSLLALCLIALATIFITPRPAQAKADRTPNNFRVEELSADSIVLAADDVANRNNYTLQRQVSWVWVGFPHDVSTSSETVKFTLRQGMRDFVYSRVNDQFRLAFFVTGVTTWSLGDLVRAYSAAAPSSLSAAAAQTSLTFSWTNPAATVQSVPKCRSARLAAAGPKPGRPPTAPTSHSFSGLTPIAITRCVSAPRTPPPTPAPPLRSASAPWPRCLRIFACGH